MIRIQLDDATRTELHAPRPSDLPPAPRDRLEIVLLADAGWPAPRGAAHLGRHPHTARKAPRLFLRQGTAGFARRRPGPPPDPARRDRRTGLSAERLGPERAWTPAQRGEAPRPHGIVLGARQLRRYLKLLKAGYRHTASTLKHKRDDVPRVAVPDNASIHVSRAFKAQRRSLAQPGAYLDYLPAYGPGLNEIEPVFQQVKRHEISPRGHTSKQEPRGSVEQGFDSYGKKLRPKRDTQLRPAA